MPFLFRVGGEVCWGSTECYPNAQHYEIEDFGSVGINVDPNRYASRYLKQLIREASDFLSGSIRLNLLYRNEEDELEIDPTKVLEGHLFDFFVIPPKGVRIPFAYNRGRIYHKGQKVRQKIQYLFGDTERLELTHIGSPGAPLSGLNDYDVLSRLESQWKHSQREMLQEALGRSLVGLEHVADDPFKARVLLALNDYGTADENQVLEGLAGDFYSCECEMEGVRPEEVYSFLQALERDGIAEETDGEFSILPKHLAKK